MRAIRRARHGAGCAVGGNRLDAHEDFGGAVRVEIVERMAQHVEPFGQVADERFGVCRAHARPRLDPPVERARSLDPGFDPVDPFELVEIVEATIVVPEPGCGQHPDRRSPGMGHQPRDGRRCVLALHERGARHAGEFAGRSDAVVHQDVERHVRGCQKLDALLEQRVSCDVARVRRGLEVGRQQRGARAR